MQEGVSALTVKPVRSVTEQHAKIQCRDRGQKESGDLAMRNYQKWQDIRINMDTICEQKPLKYRDRAVRQDVCLSVFCRAGGRGEAALRG